MRIHLKYFSFVAFIFLLASCSKKTTTPTTTTQSTSSTEQADRRGGDRKGKKGKKERPQFADMLAKMDANKDGKLALAEADGRLKEMFPQIDQNQDGFITEEEFKNAPKPKKRGGGRN